MKIALIGFMGTGKSSAGRLLAARLGVRFLDADSLIEERAGMPVKEIFAKSGEARFRAVEREVIRDAAVSPVDAVFALGGGAFMDEGSRRLIKAWGTVVCLTASVDAILERIGHGDERPLVNAPDKRIVVEELIKKRMPFYEEADIIIDTTNRSLQDVVRELEAFIKARAARKDIKRGV